MELAEFRKQFDHQLVPPYQACQRQYAEYFEISFAQFVARVHRTVLRECFACHSPVPAGRRILECLPGLQLFDLYLVTACCLGIEEAWTHFYNQHRMFLQRAASAACSNPAAAEELATAILSELALPSEQNPSEPKLGMYSGIGSLQGWLRVMVGRRAIDLHRRHGASESLDDSEGETPASRIPSKTRNPEEELSQQRYARAVRAAFERSMATLETSERLLLVLYYRDGMTLREIGALPSYRVHEATISRWLEKVHKRLRKEFESHLRSTMRLTADEIAACSEIAMTQCVVDLDSLLVPET